MEKMAVKMRRYFILFGVLALAASAAGCGGSSGGGRPGASGGATGNGGISTTTGGSTGSGGVTGSGGSTVTSTAASCTPGVSPTTPLITDFSASPAGWHATLGQWGTGVLTGSVFPFNGPNSTTAKGLHQMTSIVDSTNQTLVLSGDVAAGDYAGGGLSFNACVNTSYTGVQFTLGGTVAGCDLYFYVQTFDEKQSGPGQVGGCTTGCYVFPGVKLTSSTGVVTVKFADLSGGQLTTEPAIANEIVGLQWQFNSPAPVGDAGQAGCTGINLTITSVSFVSN
jgi:hypothetical protein